MEEEDQVEDQVRDRLERLLLTLPDIEASVELEESYEVVT